jgi:hypothetical protein
MKIKTKIMSTIFVISLLFSLFYITSAADGDAGTSEEIPVCGDVNGDASLDESDVLHLLRHTLMPDKYPLSDSADLDGSEVEDIDDVILLFNHLKNPDEYPLVDKNHVHTMEHFAPIDATCKSEGALEYWKCSVCNNTYLDSEGVVRTTDVTVPAIPHNEVIDSGKEPEIGVSGLTDGSHCSACGDVIREQEIIPALTGVILNADEGITVLGLEKSYSAGDLVSLVATIAEGYAFDGWFIAGELISEELSYSFSMPEENVALEARCHIIKYKVAVKADYGITVDGLLESYFADEDVTLSATIIDGFIFGGWYIDGELVSSDLTYTFKMEKSDLTVEAKLNMPRYTVTVKETIGCKVSELNTSYFFSEKVVLSATVEEGYVFLGWLIDGEKASDNTHYEFTMPESDVVVEPICYKIYSITAEANLEKCGKVAAPSSAYETESVTVVAIAKTGYEFIGWFVGDVLVSIDNEYIFAMPAKDLKISARFITVRDDVVAWDGTIAESFSDGSGTEEDPYLISTGSELAYLASEINGSNANIYYNKYYRLTDNIDLGGKEWNPIGCYRYGNGDFANNRAFCGHFDGDGYTVSNFKITEPKEMYYWYFGLFGYVQGSIENLAVKDFVVDIDVTSLVYIGGVAGMCVGETSSISNCYAEGHIVAIAHNTYAHIGVLIGNMAYGSVSNSSSAGSISVKSYGNIVLGGLVGYSNVTISHSYSTADLTAESTNGNVQVGGLVGKQMYGSISKSFATGNINAKALRDSYVGGLVGSESSAEITNSYRYEGQIVVNNGMPFNRNTIGEACSIERLNSAEFYKEDLMWDNVIWDFDNLDFSNGVYPHHRGLISDSTSAPSFTIGETYYEIVVESTEGGEAKPTIIYVILVREGDAIKLHFTPDEGYILLGWLADGKELINSEPLVLTPEKSLILTAVLKKEALQN